MILALADKKNMWKDLEYPVFRYSAIRRAAGSLILKQIFWSKFSQEVIFPGSELHNSSFWVFRTYKNEDENEIFITQWTTWCDCKI